MATVNKRDAVLSLLDEGGEQTYAYTPAAFFLHFPPECHRGQPAIDKHLEYFWHTGMDFVKIQYEEVFPRRPEITKPGDWANMPPRERRRLREIRKKLMPERHRDIISDYRSRLAEDGTR